MMVVVTCSSARTLVNIVSVIVVASRGSIYIENRFRKCGQVTLSRARSDPTVTFSNRSGQTDFYSLPTRRVHKIRSLACNVSGCNGVSSQTDLHHDLMARVEPLDKDGRGVSLLKVLLESSTPSIKHVAIPVE